MGKMREERRKTLNVLYIDNEVMIAWHIVVITEAWEMWYDKYKERQSINNLTINFFLFAFHASFIDSSTHKYFLNKTKAFLPYQLCVDLAIDLWCWGLSLQKWWAVKRSLFMMSHNNWMRKALNSHFNAWKIFTTPSVKKVKITWRQTTKEVEGNLFI